MKAILRRTRISPKKANLIASLVRNQNVLEAIDRLKFTPKKAAKILKKVIESALANAENNNKQSKENLYIKEIVVTEGPTYKRSLPISRGRVHPILKRTSHISVKLETQSNTAKNEPKDKQAKTPKKEEQSKAEGGAPSTQKDQSKKVAKNEPASTEGKSTIKDPKPKK